MSRGLGKMERFWLSLAGCDEQCGVLWTFEDACRGAFPEAYEPGCGMKPSLRRSLRRALRSVVQRKLIVRLGSVPAVHTIHPGLFNDNDPRRDKVMAKLSPHGFALEGDNLLCPRAYTQAPRATRATYPGHYQGVAS
jgi:hypothetical protein